MQRLFPMFPAGPPGVGLVILRLSVVTVLMAHLPAGPAPPWLVAVAAILAGLGLFTPIVAVACVLLETIHLSSAPLQAAAVVAVANACTMALLGPGAYSLDALRFGRRVL